MGKFDKVEFLIPIQEIEHGAIEQIQSLCELDFVKKVAIMPDIHLGKEVPIGTVVLAEGMISPALVSYDIGCGMCLYDTKIDAEDFQAKVDLTKLSQRLYDRIPVGTNRHHNKPDGWFKSALGDKELDKEVQKNELAQLGTLGSGNHFIEIGVTQKGTIGITVHSGSRNLGHRICTHYLKHGTWFDASSEMGLAYRQDMEFAMAWALYNRKDMIGAVLYAIGRAYPDYLAPWEWEADIVNKSHNTATWEQGGVVHRKGATPAIQGELGIIPGNMRDGVYIVRGLGNDTYLNSCSHGAGRVMGRNQAKKTLSLDSFKETMSQAGIVAKVSESTLDESPDCYKNLAQVIAYQEGIVIEVVDHIRPILNVKG